MEFSGTDGRFYLVSAPAHASHPTALARRDEVFAATLGEQAHANVRTVRRYVHAGGVASDQLAGERVDHLCGRPDATRSLIVADEQAVISPSWSVHTGAGTANYALVWAMAGENVAYDVLDTVATEDLR